MSAKYTPGPWRSRGMWVERADRPTVASVAQCHDPSRAEADARLIAAAPEMLDLLLRYKRWTRGDTKACGQEWSTAIDKVIAKIEGIAWQGPGVEGGGE